MNNEVKKNISHKMGHWRDQIIKGEEYPVLLITMPVDGNGLTQKIYRGGEFSPEQIKKMLMAIIGSL